MYEIIKITKKRNSNYNLYIKDYKEEKLEIHLDILYDYKLYSIKEIDDEAFEKMLSDNQNKLAKQQAFKLLTSSSKTKKELITKLKQKKFSQESINYAMSFVDEYGFIDEENIAQRLVEGKYKRKKYSKRAMMSRLKQKGIDSSIVEDSLSDIDDEEEYENAMYFAQKKYKSLSNKDGETIKRKIYSALTYRGFSYCTIRKVIDALDI